MININTNRSINPYSQETKVNDQPKKEQKVLEESQVKEFDKIQFLKEQIHNKTYKIDLDSLASKMAKELM